MHVLNVNDSIGLKTGGGTAERTFQMSRFLAKQGIQCTVLTLDIGLNKSRVAALEPASLVALPCLWQRFYVPNLRWGVIRRAVDEADFVHLMGHWSVLNSLVYLAARLARKPYAVCPAGALPIFGRSALLKRIYNLLVGNAIIRNASAWIAVTSGEFPHFETYGISSSKVSVIPNGVSKEDFPVTDNQDFLKKNGIPNVPMILFMGRLNIIKGPDLLLNAFIEAHNYLPEFHLIFAGPDGGMLTQLHDLAEQAGLSEFVHFLGFISGKDKSTAYHSATLLVVPSRQEAMSIVALEAGICGTPVLLTDQCGFSDVCSLDTRLEVPATTKGVEKGLISLLSDTDVLDKVTPLWLDFVEKNYVWNVIVNLYLDLYNDILGKKKFK